MPLLIHMTFKDKGQFARHHLLSLASWAKENPDHAILMYDDADLEAYLRCEGWIGYVVTPHNESFGLGNCECLWLDILLAPECLHCCSLGVCVVVVYRLLLAGMLGNVVQGDIQILRHAG